MSDYSKYEARALLDEYASACTSVGRHSIAVGASLWTADDFRAMRAEILRRMEPHGDALGERR